MTKKTVVVAACALSALFASGAAKWKNLDDKSHASGPKLTEADLLGKAVLVYYWDAAEADSLKYLSEVEKVWNSFKTKKFQVVGNYIGAKNDEKVKEAIQNSTAGAWSDAVVSKPAPSTPSATDVIGNAASTVVSKAKDLIGDVADIFKSFGG